MRKRERDSLLLDVSGAINLASQELMRENSNLIIIGLGANDPKRIFGTTKNLVEQFGDQRVMDFPTSENAMLGYGIGLAISGFPSIMIHQRFDFMLLSMDQLVNNAAKWYYMFGSRQSVPIVIRVIVGKGWGQGPTHSQSFHAWLAHVPGLKVAMPHDPQSAYDLLVSSVADPNPVVFVEHRWIHNQLGDVKFKNILPNHKNRLEALSKTETLGDPSVTVISFSYLTPRVKSLYSNLENLGIGIEHVILETIKPYDLDAIKKSVQRTGRLLVLDFAPRTNSFAKEIIGEISMCKEIKLEISPSILCHPDVIEPTSHYLTKKLYFDDADIFAEIAAISGLFIQDEILEAEIKSIEDRNNLISHDVPNAYFKGPF